MAVRGERALAGGSMAVRGERALAGGSMAERGERAWIASDTFFQVGKSHLQCALTCLLAIIYTPCQK